MARHNWAPIIVHTSCVSIIFGSNDLLNAWRFRRTVWLSIVRYRFTRSASVICCVTATASATKTIVKIVLRTNIASGICC